MNVRYPVAHDPTGEEGRSDAMAKVNLLATDFARSALVQVSEGGVRAIRYSAFGYHSPSVEGVSGILFTGQLKEVQGYYLLGNGRRAYSTTLQRFVQPDRYSPFGKGGINVYTYSLGDPVNRHDPSGNASDPLVAIAAGIVVDAFAELALGFIYRYRNLWKKAIYNIKSTKHTVTNFREVLPGVMSFVDKHHGARLNFSVHGDPGVVTVGEYLLSANEFHYRVTEAGGNWLKYDRVRMITCAGGDAVGGYLSFIQELANISGKAVDGYLGDVYYWSDLKTRNMKLVSSASKQKIGIQEGRFGFGPYNHRPISVKPQGIRRP